MATYIIGDVQGCAAQLEALLARIGFDEHRDRLWFAGDLVNRGPASLAVLRRVRDLGEAALVVLGNHDLHLLATACGARRLRRKDTFAEVLEAPDRDELLAWLRGCPLLHHDPDSGLTLVHAGLAPQWDLAEAAACAGELEAALRGPDSRRFLERMYGDGPARWCAGLRGAKRLRFITNALTRIRYCDRDGALDLEHDGPPGSQPAGLEPWYALPGRRSAGHWICFGHWATLRLAAADERRHRVVHLDTGCVWGGRLTALRLEDRRRFQVPGPPAPGSGR